MSNAKDFVIKKGKLVGYSGSDHDVVIPQGAEEIASWVLDKISLSKVRL